MDKRYLIRIISYVALALAALVLIADITVQIAGSMVQQVETATTELIETGEQVSAQGFIVRNEQVIEGVTGGYLGYTVKDGERVSVGSTVANVYADTEENKRIFESIARIEHKLALITEAEAVKGIYTVISADQKIAVLRQRIDEAAASGNPVSAELEDELLVMLYVRDLRSGKSLDEIKTSLTFERNTLKGQLGSAGQTVQSDALGYFYADCDGYEGMLDAKSVMSATISDFEALLQKEKEPVQTESKAGKVVTDYTWYLVCELPAEQVRGMSESKAYTLYFESESDRAVTMTLARLVYEYGNDRSVLVFRSENMPEGFSYTRYQTVTIVRERFDGYRVPISAVRSLNGICGVYVLRGSIVEFREIKPVDVQDGMVTVDAQAKATGDYKMLQYYDRIIVRGKELYVGKIID